jgi:hypothetical protein
MLRRLTRTEARKLRHRKAQARHIERVRACRALYQIELGGAELDALVRFQYLADRSTDDTKAVSEAIAKVIRGLTDY